MTNICSEIVLHTDESHSFVCCLSSLNLAKYDEWKDTDLIYTATWFLDGVLEEFIQKAKYRKDYQRLRYTQNISSQCALTYDTPDLATCVALKTLGLPTAVVA